MGVLSVPSASVLPQNARVRERLTALATRLEVIAQQIRTLGLVRAAEDLSQVSAEIRKLSVGDDDQSR